MTSTTRYPPELRERAMRMVVEHRGEHPLAWAAMGSSCHWTHCRCSRPSPLLASRACWPGAAWGQRQSFPFVQLPLEPGHAVTGYVIALARGDYVRGHGPPQ